MIQRQPYNPRTNSTEPPALPKIPQPPPARGPLTDFARRSVVAVLITLLLVTLAVVCWRGVHVLLEAFAGLLFALFLNTLSDRLSRHTRLSYGWALTVTVVSLFAITGGVGLLLGNRLALQVESLSQTLPQSLQRVQEYLSEYPWGRVLLEHLPQAAQSLTEAGGAAPVKGFFSGIMYLFEAVIVILVVAIFGAAEPDVYREGLLHLVPPKHRTRVGEAIDAVVFNLRWWLVGQISLMVLIGGTTLVGLWLMGVPLALTLGVIAGTMEMIPYIGAWASAVPAALMAMIKGPGHVVGVLGLFLFLHILEGYVLLPIIQRRAVHQPPALTIVMQVLFGELLGFLGLFVAAPLTVMLVVLLKMLYVEDTLGDEAVDVPGEPGNEAKPAVKSD